jgi:hypothetical protein
MWNCIVIVCNKKIKIKIFTSYTAVLTRNRKIWEIEHQLVIENKCCENKNKNKEFEFELVLYFLYCNSI